jgi:hypothetical protein
MKLQPFRKKAPVAQELAEGGGSHFSLRAKVFGGFQNSLLLHLTSRAQSKRAFMCYWVVIPWWQQEARLYETDAAISSRWRCII